MKKKFYKDKELLKIIEKDMFNYDGTYWPAKRDNYLYIAVKRKFYQFKKQHWKNTYIKDNKWEKRV
ncbi:hypothetical protein [Mycoplasmopsis bovis]|uniref:hypothetical protein n=1 Tax=Mycoplasmopsis bovis TaxID=28903 RepID=UPI00094B5720|nr:hypothetical protein [Mycoplasmopsis bovis]